MRDARRHLAQGAIRERSKQIGRARQILRELSASLDRERGGELSPRLAGLYAYMQTRLMEANSRQLDAPLQEVERLLSDLSEAWQSAAKSREAEAEVLETISVGLFLVRVAKGSHATLVQTRVNDDVWMPHQVQAFGSARVGLLKVLRIEQEIRYSNSRKFPAASPLASQVTTK